MMTLERRTGIFVGAGSSKALFDVPIQSHFINDFLKWDEKKFNPSHLSPRLHQLLLTIGDIELVLSHMQSITYPKDGPRNHQYSREFMLLRVALAHYFDNALITNLAYYTPTALNLFDGFFSRNKLKKSDIFFITTNYDMVIEKLINQIFGKNSYWYPGVDKNTNSESIPIIKLHGSANWMENRGLITQERFSHSDKILLKDPSSMNLLQYNGNNGYIFIENGIKYVPIIVPFLFQKDIWLRDNNEIWRNIFNKTWDYAEKLIEQSEQLYFWGFSLPSADFNMFTFLLKMIEKSNFSFHVVDLGKKNTNMIRLAKLFKNRAFIHRNGLKSFLNHK